MNGSFLLNQNTGDKMKYLKIVDEDIYDAMSGILFTSKLSTKRIKQLSNKHLIELLYKVRDASKEYWRKTERERMLGEKKIQKRFKEKGGK